MTAVNRAELYLGMLLTVIGSVMASLGTVLSRRALIRVSKETKVLVTYAYTSREWWCAQVTYVLGNIIHFYALKFAPASVLAPLNATGLAANVYLCSVLLNEVVTSTTLLATGGVMLGVTVCAFSTNYHREDYIASTQAYQLRSWDRLDFLFFFGLLIVTTIIGFSVLQFAEYRIDQARWDDMYLRHLKSRHISVDRQLQSLEKGLEHELVDSLKYPVIIGISYGTLAGAIGCFTVLELKETLIMLQQTSPLWQAQFWLALVLTIGSISFQNHLLNMGLVRNDAIVVIPCYYVTWITFNTIGGYIKFHEFELNSDEGKIISLALLITVASLVPLAVNAVTANTNEAQNMMMTGAKCHSSIIVLPMGTSVVTVGGLGGKVHHVRESRMRRLKPANKALTQVSLPYAFSMQTTPWLNTSLDGYVQPPGYKREFDASYDVLHRDEIKPLLLENTELSTALRHSATL